VVTDEQGHPISNASVSLVPGDLEIAEARTTASGHYHISVYPVRGQYNLSAMHGKLGGWEFDIRLREGERRTLDLTLKSAVRVSGVITAATGQMPMVNLPVQTLRNGKVVYETKSDEQGIYQLGNLPPGQYHIRCEFANNISVLLEDRQGNLWVGTGNGFLENPKGAGLAKFDGEHFQVWTTKDGLLDNQILSLYEDVDGTFTGDNPQRRI